MDTFERSPKLAELSISYKRRAKPTPIVHSPFDCVTYARKFWDMDAIDLREDVVIVLLNGGHRPIGWLKIAQGGMNEANIDPRIVFGAALKACAGAIILVHNHPSGSTEPSNEDRAVTTRLKNCGDMLGCRLLDSIILTRHAHNSVMHA